MLSAEIIYRGVIVPGGKVAHESLRLRCKFQWEHKCLLVLMVWFLFYSSGDWLACFKCKRGMYFSKFSGSLNETCFYYGFSASSYAQGWLENYGIFFCLSSTCLWNPSSFVLFVSPPRCSREVEVGELNWEESDILIRFLCCQNLMKSPR